MNYEFELIDIVGPEIFQGEYDPSDKWRWVRFVFNCTTPQKSVRVPTQVMIRNLIFEIWSETDQEIRKRAYSFLRKKFELVFRNKLDNENKNLEEVVKSEILTLFKINSANEANDKLDFKKGDKFTIQV